MVVELSIKYLIIKQITKGDTPQPYSTLLPIFRFLNKIVLLPKKNRGFLRRMRIFYETWNMDREHDKNRKWNVEAGFIEMFMEFLKCIAWGQLPYILLRMNWRKWKLGKM